MKRITLRDIADRANIKLEVLQGQIKNNEIFWNKRTGKPISQKQMYIYTSQYVPYKVLINLMRINKITLKKLGISDEDL